MNFTEADIRAAAFLWLQERSRFNGGVFSRTELANGFSYSGHIVTLVGPPGIWRPKGFRIPISITTTSTGPYEDGFTDEGFLVYRYRGQDPRHRDNVGLRNAFRERVPLIYFHSIKPGKYVAVWPVFILEDDPARLRILAAIDPAYSQAGSNMAPESMFTNDASAIGVRRYITAITRQRLHQTAFREFVLDAYKRQCTMCRLQHAELLDAAHIIPDSDPDGIPVVPNGLSLCKIHHAAYDKNIIGITPDYTIKVRDDVLQEVDGPMLKYGLQSLDNTRIILPGRRSDHPDRDRLARRYERFIA